MKVAIVGYAQSGRSTLYRAAARGQAKGDVTAVPVPDERFDAIVKQVQPKKITPATVILHDDLDGVGSSGKSLLTQTFLDKARRADLLLHLVRGFESPMAPFHAEVDPERDLNELESEFVLADLQVVESRLKNLGKNLEARKPGTQEFNDKQLLERLQPELENGVPVRNVELDEDEAKTVRDYQMLSAKQSVVAFNVGEDEAGEASDRIQALIADLAEKATPAFSVCATLEEEIAMLDAEDQPEFLESAGIQEPASDKLMRAVYDGLGLITFFTAGENETRAWPLRKGSSAVKAADTIHSDIARGFIRAEVVSYEDYSEAGSLDAAYKGGKMRLEGKEYVVADGDLLHIRNKS